MSGEQDRAQVAHCSRLIAHSYTGTSSLFGLAPCGVCPARCIAAAAVRSYRTFSPLPRRCRRGGMFSVALSVEESPTRALKNTQEWATPLPDVIRHTALRSSDFPPSSLDATRATARSGCLRDDYRRRVPGVRRRHVGFWLLRSGATFHRASGVELCYSVPPLRRFCDSEVYCDERLPRSTLDLFISLPGLWQRKWLSFAAPYLDGAPDSAPAADATGALRRMLPPRLPADFHAPARAPFRCAPDDAGKAGTGYYNAGQAGSGKISGYVQPQRCLAAAVAVILRDRTQAAGARRRRQ